MTIDTICIQHLLDKVASDAAGSLITFLGTTRCQFNNRKVKALHYEAHPQMCIHQINLMINEAKLKFNLLNVAIVHRVGSVGVGETSVAVAVASVHRKNGYEASVWIMDQVKAKLPVWKREYYWDADPEWKQNPEGIQKQLQFQQGKNTSNTIDNDKDF